MTDKELTRVEGERKGYSLAGVGTMRLEGFSGRRATAEARGRNWSFGRSGFWQRAIEATDSTGVVVGVFEPRTLRGGGTLRWGARELQLRPASAWRSRYALADDGRELALLEGKGWGKRPVKVTSADGELDPGLLLFATFVVRALAEDATAAASGATA
jgi:hypothetical protein